MPTPRHTLTLVLLLVAASSLIFTTGAAVIDGDADTLADGDLAVQPADGPNGDYSYLNDDGEIVVDVSPANPNLDSDFEGVNVDSTGRIDDVFTVTYTGEAVAHVWIGYESENVTFVADGESIEGDENNVTLAPNQTVRVGLALDTRGEVAGTQLGADEFSIEANETAIGEPDEAPSTSSTSSSAGDADTVVTTKAPSDDRREFVASDVGDGDAVQLDADGMHLAGGNVTLDGLDVAGVRNDRIEVNAVGNRDPVANGSALTAPTTPRSMAYLALDHDFAPHAADAMTVRFSAARDHLNATGRDPEDVTFYRQTDAGDWERKPVEVVSDDAVRTRGLSEDRVYFRATTDEFSTFAVAERVPRFDVTETTLEPRAIDPGEAATVRATVTNGGGAAGTETVTLTADGDPVANETVALAPNETATVALASAYESPGEYDLAVGGADAGSLLVGDPADGDESADDAGTGTGSGTDGDAGDGGAQDGDGGGGDGAAGESGTGPTEEPSAIDLTELGGLLALVAIAAAGIALVRRLPRS